LKSEIFLSLGEGIHGQYVKSINLHRGCHANFGPGPPGNYRIMVGGTDRGPLTVSMGFGETEFRSPVEPGKLLLTES
jgi:hypothetical protein